MATGGFDDLERSKKRFTIRGEDREVKILIDLEDSLNTTTRVIALDSSDIDSQGLHQSKSLKVNIPKGIVQGQKIRLAGR